MQADLRKLFHKLTDSTRRRELAFYLSLFVLLAAFNYAHFTYRREVPRIPYLTGFDDLGYFVYARSLFFDKDINFRNDYQYFVSLFNDFLAGPPFAQWLRENPTRPPNFYPVGTGLAALPFLLAFHLLAKVLVFMGLVPVAPSPFSSWYPLAYLLGNLSWGVLGLWVTSQLLKHFFSSHLAHLATLSCVCAGPALFYVLYQPGMSHLTSLCLVAVALWSVLKWDSQASSFRRTAYAALAGFALGFALAVRTANLPIFLLLCVPLTGRQPIKWRQRLKEGLIALCSAGLFFLPQLLAWRYLYGKFLVNSYGYSATVLAPHFGHVLFGRRHGLFFWHPWLLLAFVGLLGLARYQPRLAFSSLGIILGVAWIYGNWQVYWLGASFGMRGYVDVLPLFALGAAWIIERIQKLATSRLVLYGTITIFSIINCHLMICFRGAVITVDGPLYWSQTLSGGQSYWKQLAREWRILTTWQWGASPGERAFPWEDVK